MNELNTTEGPWKRAAKVARFMSKHHKASQAQSTETTSRSTPAVTHLKSLLAEPAFEGAVRAGGIGTKYQMYPMSNVL